MFELGTILFSVVPILVIILVIIVLVVFIQRGRERSRQLEDISRKLDKLIQQSQDDEN